MIEKQISYWISGAKEDLESAEILINKKRILHGLFFCHLAIEKALKAHVVKITNDIAPRSHNLIYLAEKGKVLFDENDVIFLGILMKYQLQGRYPDYNPRVPEELKARDYLIKTKNLLKWLNKKL
jgi:HEPN domain-containing protein